MGLLSIEHARASYRADMAFYGLAVVTLALWLGLASRAAQHPALAGWTLAGLAAWTLVEYGLHRFVLHRLWPFRVWHGEHHLRPHALICTPTLLSASLMAGLVFLPALWAGGLWFASAFTLGMLLGYLAYTVTHHATHHWRADSAWLRQRKRWHALHHHDGGQGAFGVTTGFWDHVFGSRRRSVRAAT